MGGAGGAGGGNDGPTFQWSTTFGGSGSIRQPDVAVDANGNIAIVGQFDGTIIIGSDTHESAGEFDIFVAYLDASGSVNWSGRYGNAQDQYCGVCPVHVTFDASGNVIVVGPLSGTIGFDSFMVSGASDAFVAKFDPTGAAQWVKSFVSENSVQINAVLGDAGGDVFMVGDHFGELTFDESSLEPFGAEQGFIARSDPSGALSRFDPIAGNDANSVDSIDATATGVVVGGSFSGTMELNDTLYPSVGGGDLFLLEFDSSGDEVWGTTWPSLASGEIVDRVVAGPAGFACTGLLSKTIDVSSVGGSEIGDDDEHRRFLVGLDPSHAITIGAAIEQSAGKLGFPRAQGLGFDLSGGILLGAGFHGDFGFGRAVVTATADGYDVGLMRIAPSNELLWLRRYGDDQDQLLHDLEVTNTGDFVIVGTFEGAIDFGGDSHVYQGAEDLLERAVRML